MTAIATPPAASSAEAATKSAKPPKRRRPPITPGQIASYIFIAIIMVLYLFPLVFLVNTALKTNANFFADPTGITQTFAFGNFWEAWQKGNFAAYVLNSVVYTAAAATLGTLVALLLAYPVSRGYLKHSKLWYGLFVVMLFLPNALMTQFQLLLRLGLYDTQIGYILIMASGLGVGPLIIYGYVKSVPKDLDEAAALDGVGYFRFVFTFLPALIKPVLATSFILSAIGVWNDIILATLLLPDPSKSPVTLGLFTFQGTYTSQWGLLSAATIIVATPLVIAYVFLQRYLVGGIGGAVKG